MTDKVFMAAAEYVQGPGVLDRLGRIVGDRALRPLVIIDIGVAERLEARIARSFDVAGRSVVQLRFEGEVTLAAIEAAAQAARDVTADLIVGVGGGKTLDTAKGVALRLKLDMVSCPTIASTDAPASRGLVIYNDDHGMAKVEQMPRNPCCVVVDTQLIADAPAIYLSAGIGDALAKKFEAEACQRSGGLNKHGARPNQTALAIADACHTVLRKHAAGALRAADDHIVDDDLEATVEACILMSAVAFENGGLSLAHAIAVGLGDLPEAHAYLHGHHVAYALLLQLAMEGWRRTQLLDMVAYYREVRLPTALAQIGLGAASDDQLRQLCQRSLSIPIAANTVGQVSVDGLLNAIRRIEHLNKAEA